jgi:hypothetical protein
MGGWQIWAGLLWGSALVVLLYVIREVPQRLSSFWLSANGPTIIIPQNRVWAAVWLAVCLWLIVLSGAVVVSLIHPQWLVHRQC